MIYVLADIHKMLILLFILSGPDADHAVFSVHTPWYCSQITSKTLYRFDKVILDYSMKGVNSYMFLIKIFTMGILI